MYAGARFPVFLSPRWNRFPTTERILVFPLQREQADACVSIHPALRRGPSASAAAAEAIGAVLSKAVDVVAMGGAGDQQQDGLARVAAAAAALVPDLLLLAGCAHGAVKSAARAALPFAAEAAALGEALLLPAGAGNARSGALARHAAVTRLDEECGRSSDKDTFFRRVRYPPRYPSAVPCPPVGGASSSSSRKREERCSC